MDQRLSRIEEKLDRHTDILAGIQGNLQEHMRRTEIAESNIDKLAGAMAPIQEHVALTRASSKLITGLIAIAGAVAAIWQLYK